MITRIKMQEKAKMNRLTIAIINTLIIVLIIPLAGLLLDKITNIILPLIASKIGRNATLFIANRLTFLGTMIHEFAHALFAFCTGAHINKIELFHPENNTLGKVMFSTRGGPILSSIQLSVSAVAPMIVGTVTESLLFRVLKTKDVNIVIRIFIIYTMISIFIHMTMSWQDIINYVKGLPICFIIICTVLYITGFSIIK